MPWTGGVGSGNLILDANENFAARLGSFQSISCNSLHLNTSFIVQTATNIAGSAAEITGRPQFYVQVRLGSTDYLMPLYRKV